MNANEAKNILQRYRRGTSDADDPLIAEALVFAKQEPELATWLEQHCQRQFVIGAKLRQLAVPDGLKEQIISEHAAKQRTVLRRRKILFALAAIIVVFGALAVFQIPFAKNPAADDTLAVYRHQMIGIALRGYGMDLFTNNPTAVRDYLTQQKAPVDYVLPAALQKVALAGCAIEGWQNAKVSMICFRTGKALPTAAASDLWLFVVDRAAVKDPPPIGPPTLFNANQITAAAWTQGDKVYLLATEGEEAALRSFL